MTFKQVKLFVYLFCAIGIIYFFAQNAESKVDFYLFGMVFADVSVIILMFLSFCFGMLFWVLFNYINLPFKTSSKSRLSNLPRLKSKK